MKITEVDEIYNDKEKFKELIKETSEYFNNELETEDVNLPCVVFGDIHGQYKDLIELMSKVKDLNIDTNMVFLGDLVDRGSENIKTIIFILLLKKARPENIKVLRGNHENRHINSIYGFKDECDNYDPVFFDLINKLFIKLPITCTIDNKYFCVHGGISDNIVLYDKQFTNDDAAILLWSDPLRTKSNNDFEKNPRGAGILYGKKIVENFLNKNKLIKILRGHEVSINGYQKDFNGLVYTIWSAPKYCGGDAKGSFLYININGDESFVISTGHKPDIELNIPKPIIPYYFSSNTDNVIIKTKQFPPVNHSEITDIIPKVRSYSPRPQRPCRSPSPPRIQKKSLIFNPTSPTGTQRQCRIPSPPRNNKQYISPLSYKLINMPKQ